MSCTEDGMKTWSEILSECDKARRDLEDRGVKISNERYNIILAYSTRKLKLNNKPPEYLPLLLRDEIKNSLFRDFVNSTTLLMAATD